ncbi:hypothetical protein F5X98DRAFT_368799 [Xylaria grammica]|nr:hypothetical protein F5X98DRAFT_368799 [Xylaria grammica]
MPTRTTTTRLRSRATGLLDHDAEFLNRLAARVEQARQHAKHRKKMEGVFFIKPKYAAETEVNKATIQSLTRATMQDFFLWVCEAHRIKSWGTSQEHIRQFQQLYTTVTGHYPNRNDIKELYKYHDRFLIPRFDLRAPNVDGKPVLNVDSLRVILVFNIAYNTSVRPLGLQRLNDSGCYMIICYTGVRLAELVHNERKPPKDGSLDELLGVKAVMAADDDVDKEPNDPDSAALCALLLKETVKRDRVNALCYEDIVMMVVRHPVTGRATLAMSIKFIHHKGCDNKPRPTIFFFTRSKKLLFCPILLFVGLALFSDAFYLDCLKDANSVPGTEVPLKTPFFRRVARDSTVSEDEAMLRRGAANAANGIAPDSVGDQMMRHNPKYFMFQDAYLNQIAEFHLQNAFLGEEMEDQMFRLLAHVSLTCDLCATRDMYCFDGQENEAEIRELTAKINSKRAQAREKEIEEYVKPAIDLVIPERAILAKTLCHQPDNLSDKEIARLKTTKRKRTRPSADLDPPVASKQIKFEVDPDVEFKPTPGPFPLPIHPNQNDYFDDNYLEAKERAKQLGQPIIYSDKRCKDVKLHTANHFRNHVQSVHKIKLRTTEQVQQRRARKVKLRRSRSTS